MQALPGCIAALVVALLYYGWRAWWRARVRTLRERVAFMLWRMAQENGTPPFGTDRRTRKIVTI